ncbi:MAG: hypothetical protein PWQ82_1312 [Thermosediminibacterales bacterium]|nr:hypothetical protein [Thermosediminibacterales bacterium]MDK2836362.1 hypothetical protein [Thermosediminibacterales bacterium]
MKKIPVISIALIITISLIVTAVAPSVSAAVSPKIYIDDKPVWLSPKPLLFTNTTFVPLIPFFEKLGGVAYLDSSNHIITVYYENYILKFDTKKGYVLEQKSGRRIKLTFPSYSGRTYVPLRAVSEFIDIMVQWIGSDKSIRLHPPIKNVTVLNYQKLMPNHELVKHSGEVDVISTEAFESHVKYLKEHGYSSLNLEQLKDFVNGKNYYNKSVLLTFDGGYPSSFSYAYPILKKYGLKGVIFVETSAIGRPGYLTWEQLKTMADSGVFEIGSITHNMYRANGASYKILSTRPAEIIKDLEVSKVLIKALVERDAYAFAYPQGIYNDAIKTYVQEAGFKMAFTTKNGSIKQGDDLMALKRNNIYRWMDLEYFKNLLQKHD